MRTTPRLLSILTASALTIAALPATAAECKSLQRVTSLDLIDLPSGRIGITAVIAGKPETLLVDTGGVISQLTKRTVQELRLTPTRGDTTRGRLALRGVNGARSDEQVRLPSITLGGLRQEGAYFFVAPELNPKDNRRGEFDGILGPDFLQHFDADFDFAAHKLNLFSPDHCAGQVVYWQAPVVAVVPFSLEQGAHITFPMELDGKKVSALLDTGAARTNLKLEIAERTFGVDVNSPDVEKVGELNGGFSANVYRRRFKALTVQAVTVANPVVNLLPNLINGAVRPASSTGSLIGGPGALPDLLLGMPTLSQLHVYVAYGERKLYITVSNTAQGSQPAPAAQAESVRFCPSPSDSPVGLPAAAIPTTDAGMGAFRDGNFPLAYANLRPLADNGSAEAERELGIVLRQSCGPRGAGKSPAAAWFEKAAQAGDMLAAAQLGDMYEFGDGVSRDGASALKWLSQAANTGQQLAMTDLGELYFEGLGVAEDRYQGLVWSVRAGEKGAPVALIHIGREYASGLALPKDNTKAVLFMSVGIQRLAPFRRKEFQPALDAIARQMNDDAMKTIRQNTQKWKPGEGILAQVLADADKLRAH